eukprot:CAMPEP_0182424306 /NCGR_PEP_ID=MMETSP1167-20130531/10498_1 /TAXON_ID=2988 /ORGANISM="Mallomonas Sp, Strain CCMP3275" /LENGTH=152 /DNA_ID=CAMNT_0024604017 /DNA_START=83 /DNA_END=538 /DNA_ORIENTATION=+
MVFTEVLSRTELSVQIFSSLSFYEILQLGNVSKKCNDIAKVDIVWKVLYSAFLTKLQKLSCDGIADDALIRKIYRPWGADCIGWKVSIYQEPTNDWWEGHIVDYRPCTMSSDMRNEEYLISYTDPVITEKWEVEVRHHSLTHQSGISRFDFL